MRRLLGDERAVPVALEFLENTRVGKMPGRILLAGVRIWKRRNWRVSHCRS